MKMIYCRYEEDVEIVILLQPTCHIKTGEINIYPSVTTDKAVTKSHLDLGAFLKYQLSLRSQNLM